MRLRLARILSVGLAVCGLLVFARQAPQGQPLAAAERQEGAAGPAGARGQGVGRGNGAGTAQRKRVLAWADTRNGVAQHDSVGHALAIIERLGYESGGTRSSAPTRTSFRRARKRPTARPPAADRV